MMMVAAARALKNDDVCLVGIGMPSAACNLARLTHAPDIASCCDQVFVIVSHSPRAFVPKVDFVTSFGFGTGGNHRQRLGLTTTGPSLIVTDLCLMRPHPETKELLVTSVHSSVTREEIAQRTGWPVQFAGDLSHTDPPTAGELAVLRDLLNRSGQAGVAGSS